MKEKCRWFKGKILKTHTYPYENNLYEVDIDGKRMFVGATDRNLIINPGTLVKFYGKEKGDCIEASYLRLLSDKEEIIAEYRIEIPLF